MGSIADKRTKAREALARNLRTLMQWEGLSQPELARRTRGKVKQKTISNILNGTHSPRIDNLDAIADAFGLQGWHLIMPQLPEDLAHCKSLAKLVEDYMGAAPSGKDHIESIAERERQLRPTPNGSHPGSAEPPPAPGL